ncbi:MAG: DUF3426 domain-containing protein, partial [Gammaproteobacteria bacterium]
IEPEAIEPEAIEPEAIEPEAIEPEAIAATSSGPLTGDAVADAVTADEVADAGRAEHAVAAMATVVGPAAMATPTPPPRVSARADDAVPALLRADYAALAREQARAPRTGRWWLAAGVLLAVALFAQLALTRHDALARMLPAAQPWLAALCAGFPCPRSAAATARGDGLRLLARDVREHPQYEDALLVNATLLNAGDVAQPFPVIELVLHDGTGRAVGARRLHPREYLDHSIAVDAGMLPGQPVFVVIELAAPSAAATSFEFHFL